MLLKASVLSSYLPCKRVGEEVKRGREREREKVETELPISSGKLELPPIDSWRSFAQISLAGRRAQLKQC